MSQKLKQMSGQLLMPYEAFPSQGWASGTQSDREDPLAALLGAHCIVRDCSEALGGMLTWFMTVLHV